MPTSRQERRRRLLVSPTPHEAGCQAVGRGAGRRRQILPVLLQDRVGAPNAIEEQIWSGESRLEGCSRSRHFRRHPYMLRLDRGSRLAAEPVASPPNLHDGIRLSSRSLAGNPIWGLSPPAGNHLRNHEGISLSTTFAFRVWAFLIGPVSGGESTPFGNGICQQANNFC